MVWLWTEQREIPEAEWMARADSAPRCSPSCAKQPEASGHRRDCRRLKALVKLGVMHPDVLKLRRRRIEADGGGR